VAITSLQQFSITPTGRANLTQIPRATITGVVEVLNEATNTWSVLADYTGANALEFPTEMRNRTDAEVAEVVAVVSRMLLLMKAGVWDGGQ